MPKEDNNIILTLESTRNERDSEESGKNESSSAVEKEKDEEPGEPIKKIETICRYFRRGICKHGLRGVECRYQYPRMCRKYIEHGTRKPNGCTLGKNCKQFHPLMCLDSLRKAECYDENCTYHHIKGTKRQPALVKNTQQSCQKSSQPEKEKPTTDIISQENENQTGHFLEVIRLMKAEILSEMNQKIASLTAQIQSIQPPQHQVVTPQLMPYPQQAIPQSINPLMFTPLPPRGAQQPIQRVQFQTPPTI